MGRVLSWATIIFDVVERERNTHEAKISKNFQVAVENARQLGALERDGGRSTWSCKI